MDQYVIAIDQGTTSCRTLIFDERGNIFAQSQKEFTQIYPHPGWVEHNAEEILNTQLTTLHHALSKVKNITQIKSIGITNQRETTVLWDKSTGKPVCNAIVWQDRRTAPVCEDLKKKGLENYIKKTTGLVPDAYFSATKIKWILEHEPTAFEVLQQGNLLFGTIDTWLLWHLTAGRVHATDYTNASRTMLFNIASLQWDDKMLDELQIPKSILPKVQPSLSYFGDVYIQSHTIPVMGIAGDQQAALFGHGCSHEGEAKNTYGTGCFMLMNTGDKQIVSQKGLLATIICSTQRKPQYALEGSVFIAGAAIQWLRDGLKILDDASQSASMATAVPDNGGVYMVPAFAGLGTPYWDMYARGAIFGITRDTTHHHIVRAALESIAYQTCDVIQTMTDEAGIQLAALKVDGGATHNHFLMQWQADMLDCDILIPRMRETTAWGAALLAGTAVGVYEEDNKLNSIQSKYSPQMSAEKRKLILKKWSNAVQRSMNWENI
ncbi:MAG: glycerol kinase GlpK [Cytophagales bacterium]|nr:glycerol kinase GlpK [Cytophagales bacterium]